MTMIEKVARAICIESGISPDESAGWLLSPERKQWHNFEKQARAAIEAMREPTDRMVLECNRFLNIHPDDRMTLNRTFSEMIDVALREPVR